MFKLLTRTHKPAYFYSPHTTRVIFLPTYYAQHNHLKSLDDVDGFGAAVSSKPGKLKELIHADFSHNALAYVPVSSTAALT